MDRSAESERDKEFQDRRGIGLTTFFASVHPTDTCGTNGLPLTPNSIRILGRFQQLKTLYHPYLCEYIELIRGRHERLVVVAENFESCLDDFLQNGDFASIDELKHISYSLLLALDKLHENGIVHRNLSPANILLDNKFNIKLAKYGLYHMTGWGEDVTFPIGCPPYIAPEVFLTNPCSFSSQTISTPAADIWSIGMVILDCYLLGNLWSGCKDDVQGIVVRLLNLFSAHESKSGLESILKYSNSSGTYQGMDKGMKSFLSLCLQIDPTSRPSAFELLHHEFLRDFTKNRQFSIEEYRPFPAVSRSENLVLPDYNALVARLSEAEDEDHLACRPIKEIFYLWALAGGDVFTELKRHGLMKSKPPILSLPSSVLNNGETFGTDREEELMLDETTVMVSLAKLRQRLKDVEGSLYHPLIIEDELNPVDLSETAKLPLVIREKDVVYQSDFIRTTPRELEAITDITLPDANEDLMGYPFTRKRILKEAGIDIPPPVRSRVWAALLNLQGDVLRTYDSIDKESITPTDRQIDVDIPRCHQYDHLLSSPAGHRKFKRILKSWVVSHPKLVYWQGLDSLCAPFLSLNFNNEALAYGSLSAFIPKYLYNFFLKDNSLVVQEYLAVFSHMIAFHDPELYTHLMGIGFMPELYAIPWFLTMFSHVFPLHKIFYLWDTLLLGNSMLPFCIGVSILQQLRDQLLSFGFNECILLFSDMPEIDIERCVKDSIKLFNHTPPSTTLRKQDNPENRTKAPEEEKYLNLPDKEPPNIQQLRTETCPRISARDLVRICQLIQRQDLLYSPQQRDTKVESKESKRKQGKGDKNGNKQQSRQSKVLVVDCRSPEEFITGHFENSINIPYSSAFTEAAELAISPSSNILQSHKGRMVMILGNKGNEPASFGERLVTLGYRRVAVMDGSASTLKAAGYFTVS